MRITLFLFLFISNSILANPDSLKAIQILEQVINNIDIGKLEEVEPHIQKGLLIFEKQNDLYNWLFWHYKIGNQYASVEQYNKALIYFKKGLDTMWRKPRNNEELRKVAGLNSNIGWVYWENLNAFEPAVEYYERYKVLLRDSIKESDAIIAKYVYNSLGVIYGGLRDQAKAAHHFEMARQISKKESDWNLYRKASSNLRGAYKELEQYDLASEVIEESLQHKDSMHFEDRIDLFLDIGLHYYHLNDFQQSQLYTDKAKNLFDDNIKTFSKKEKAEHQYDFNFNYGRISKGKKKFKDAENYYTEALKLLETDLKEGNRRKMAIMHLNFGQLYLEQQQFKKAKKYFQDAIAYLSPILSEYTDPKLVPINSLIGEDLLAYTYQKLGNIAVAQYQVDRNISELDQAIRYYELADLVGQLRIQNYTSEESSLTALATQRDLKEEMQFALFEFWQAAPQDRIKAKMFAFSEKSRSFLLLEKDKQSNEVLEWNEETQNKYNLKKVVQLELEENIYALKQDLNKDRNIDINKLQEQLLKVNDELAYLKQQKNKAAKFKFSPPYSVNAIQQILSNEQALVEFFVGESHIYTYAISKADFKIYRKPKTENYYQTIGSLRSNLVTYSDDVELFGARAYFLYEHLLKKTLEELPKSIKQLVIVRDQFQNFIPFEILLTQPFSKDMYYNNMPYLIQYYSISYANSASIYAMQMKTPQDRAKKLFAGYAPKYNSREIAQKDTLKHDQLTMLVRSGNYELIGAKKEVVAISELLDGDSFIGEIAGESHFKTNAADYKILLLSMHGIADQYNPHFSRLLFTSGASVEKEDDELKPIELYNMNLNADLVVLSACETGYGKLYPGEGVFSFSRAFFAADVPSTVMSLWKVNDQSTSKIMIDFFKNLEKRLSKDEALRQAKLTYLNSNQNNRAALHPYFWSGLLVSGNIDALNLRTGLPVKYYFILFFLLLSIFSFRFFKKKFK